MKPFIVSLPRTRSSILYKLMSPYATNCLNMLTNIHPEYFLDVSIENSFNINNVAVPSEVYPIIKNNIIETYYMYPYYFKNSQDRLQYKLSLLKEQKNKGIEYFFKGSINIFDDYKNILDFFADRKIVLCKRRDMHELIISFLVAVEIKSFHKTKNTALIYDNLENITISNTTLNGIENFIDQLLKVNRVEQYLIKNKFNFNVLYYEDLDTEKQLCNAVSTIFETDSWNQYINKNDHPLDTKLNYKKIVKNYDSLKNLISQIIESKQ